MFYTACDELHKTFHIFSIKTKMDEIWKTPSKPICVHVMYQYIKKAFLFFIPTGLSQTVSHFFSLMSYRLLWVIYVKQYLTQESIAIYLSLILQTYTVWQSSNEVHSYLYHHRLVRGGSVGVDDGGKSPSEVIAVVESLSGVLIWCC